MYKHKITLTNKRKIEFTSDDEKIMPCSTGIEGSLFFFYSLEFVKEKERIIIPAYQVVSIDTKEISNEA